ncbi:hypothetical protein D9V29_11460 [Mycetocola manganoxydans]|uniref:Uncharacterized protein n=1 Tax=Mycetocola manganoxydans TaxID=699879 RepID=A0A3L6ZPV3_9MICO|nr:DUF6804 family protein [Mycetocola manganoxydans]RLP69829.1 hypothetical protein D9V29_11460 [Mycetocola manganoxydans]GHD50220.1 hypothetical protein GCM10008097_24020 [Mycetocola manganoxydans]
MAKAVPARPDFTRPALAPGILAGIVLFVGVALIDSTWFIVVHYVVTVLAVIIAWFAIQARMWWWLLVLVPIIVLWNPVLPLGLSGVGWMSAQLIAPILFVAAGLMIRVPVSASGAAAR